MMLRRGWDESRPSLPGDGGGPGRRHGPPEPLRAGQHSPGLAVAGDPSRGPPARLRQCLLRADGRAGPPHRTHQPRHRRLGVRRTTAFAARFGLERKSQGIMRRQHLAELATGPARRSFRRGGRGRPTTSWSASSAVRRRTWSSRWPSWCRDQRRPDRRPRHRGRGVLARAAGRLRGGQIARGNRLYRLVARHRETGELGGHTVVAVEERAPGAGRPARHRRRPAHRGHRLGLLLKAGMLLWLREAEPQIDDHRHLERRVERPHDRGQRGARLPGDGPRAPVPAGPLSPAQSRAVSTSGPSSVIAMVCSMCAPRDPSPLRSVQPSRSV